LLHVCVLVVVQGWHAAAMNHSRASRLRNKLKHRESALSLVSLVQQFRKVVSSIRCGLHVLAGTFGRVLECWDRKYKDYCAVKIVRNVDKYRHAAMIEVRGFIVR
jgi:hypothetical protein